MWIFGYGSLVWKVDFPVKRKLTGHINGYLRRFWQASTYHRGTAENSGRVVTLVPALEEDAVSGVAYEIHDHDEEMVRKLLDFREKGGYTLEKVTFYPVDLSEDNFQLELYIANDESVNYLGPASDDVIANQIYVSVGLSGSNIEYLYKLSESLRTLLPHENDEHIIKLERRVKELQAIDIDNYV